MMTEQPSIAEVLARKFAENREVLQEAQAQLSRFRIIVDASPLPTVLVTRTGETIYANAAYTAFLGCTFEDLVGHGWKNYIDPSVLNKLLLEWNTFRQGNKDWWDTKTVYKAKGALVRAVIVAVRIPDDGFAAFIVPDACSMLLPLCPVTAD
jgi:PAS domain S-box-containing protein